ncbi:MAG: gliding motility-associated C-terminal domain-containing protein [bacterium]
MMKLLSMVIIGLVLYMPVPLAGGGFGIDKNDIRPRIITPNNDGLNDFFWIFYRNDFDLQVSGTIYDIDGAEVARMFHKTGAAEYSLCWDGKDGAGSVVPAGAYVYQVKAEDSIYNGIVIVAR